MNKKNKFAIINEGAFINLYINYLESFCHEHKITVDILEPEFAKQNIKEIIDKYDYIYSDKRINSGAVTIFHRHTIKERINRISNPINRFFYFLGHYKQIKETEKFFTSFKKIVAVSSVIKEDLIKNYNIDEKDIIIAHAGFVSPKNKITEFKPFDKNDCFVVSMSAIGFVNKGGYILLGALRKFKKLYPKIKIKANIIYPKYEKNWGVSLYIKFFGLKDYIQFFERQEDMYGFYEKSHCFVCPSIAEAFGRVVTEAMYAKRPVIIGSNIGAIDIIEDGVNGFIFKADKNKELNLALKIKEVYDKYDNLKPLIDTAFNDAKNCTWKNFAKIIFDGLYLKD